MVRELLSPVSEVAAGLISLGQGMASASIIIQKEWERSRQEKIIITSFVTYSGLSLPFCKTRITDNTYFTGFICECYEIMYFEL